MFNQELFASAFARAVELMASAEPDRDQQEAALRALVALAELSASSLRLYDGVLSVDDVSIPETAAHLAFLVQRLQEHHVSELMIGRQSEPLEVLALLRGLAGRAESGPTIKERLRDVRSRRIMVILEPAEDAPARRPLGVAEAFEAIERIETDSGSMREWDALHATTSELAVPEAEVVIEMPAAAASQEPETTASAVEEPTEPALEVPAIAVDSDTPLGEALASVVLDPYGRALLDRLTLVSQRIQAALREDQTEEAIRALAVITDLEPGAPEGSLRNSYAIVLKRALTRDVLAQVAPFLLTPALMDPAAKVIRRARGEGVDVLLGLLATAESLRERKAYMSVLRTIPQGAEKVLAMLGHHKWFVVRNVAELAGELRIESAVPELGRLFHHSDQRVQRAAAVALAKIGSVSTVEPLRRTLREGTPELRSLIASSIGGAHARALAMPLVALAEEETHPEVLKEYYRALGRIGSPEAVQALAQAAEPGGRILKRKPVETRLAAVEGLRLAGSAATGILRGLAGDGERAVRDAAAAAVRSPG